MSEVQVGGRRFLVEAGGVRAVTPEVDEGFSLVVDGHTLTAADFELVEVWPEDGRLSWRLACDGVVVNVTVDGPDGAAVARTQMAVSGHGRLERVEVERWGAPAGLALGQPLLGHGWFAGLQHPGAEGFALAVDVDLHGHGPYRLPPLVVGTCDPGRELDAFWDELDRVRAAPPRLIVLANNWYQLGYVGRMSEATVAAELDGFGQVAAQHGLALDWYCLDDPWDGEWEPESGLWGRMAPGRFPGGLPALQAAAEGRVGAIGLWISPWGGYFDRHDHRVAWGRDHGFEVEDGPPWDRLCPAGDAYRRHLAESMGRFSAEGVSYWKIDGVQFDCRRPDHGHGDRTDQMDRFAALLHDLRAAAPPGTVLTFTSGSNPSPWWLRHADFIWRGGLDDDAPEEFDGGRHERFATYIDSCLDALRHTGVPVSAIVTFSLVENEARAYGDEGEGPDAWARHCWLLAGRGTHHHDLYVSPGSLSPEGWDVLAPALAWARANQAVLARSHMIGGRPQAGEPYGFLSVNGDRAIACLRNPAARSQGLTLDLGGEVSDVTPVYGRPLPAGRHIDVELEPFEVVLVSGRWQPGTQPGPPG